jgi:hypothetical protein
MKHFLAFLKATLLGGVIVVFPAWLAVLLVLKALAHLEIFVKPISKHLPQAIGHPRVIAILVLVGLCFLVGLAIHTAIGRRIERAAERLVLDKIPGYTTLHGEGKDPEGTQLQQVIGFSDERRKVAISLGVDPYSTNTILQHELDGIAWASFAGGATFTLATLPVSGAAGTALTVTEVSGDFNDILKEKSPTDLRIMNRRALLELGATEKEAERFLNNNAFSPSAQTAFVLNLRSMKGVANRRAFVRLAGETSSSETDAIFCVQTAALMSKLNKEQIPLARIELLGDFPICIAKDGTTVVALQWDYAAWTSGAAQVSNEIEKFAAKPPRNKKVFVALSGDVSPRLREELQARGHTLTDRVAPGPLK